MSSIFYIFLLVYKTKTFSVAFLGLAKTLTLFFKLKNIHRVQFDHIHIQFLLLTLLRSTLTFLSIPTLCSHLYFNLIIYRLQLVLSSYLCIGGCLLESGQYTKSQGLKENRLDYSRNLQLSIALHSSFLGKAKMNCERQSYLCGRPDGVIISPSIVII